MKKEKEEVLKEEEDIMASLDGAIPSTDDEAMDAPVAEEELSDILADEEAVVETVAKPSGRSVSSGRKTPKAEKPAPVEEKPQPALTAASRPSAKERQQRAEEYHEARNMRQDEVVIVGRYLAAERRNNVMEGRISGVEVREEHVFWTIYEGPVIVYIPFKEALPSLPDGSIDGEDAKSAVRRQKQLMSKSIGATVPFTVESIVPDGDTYLVYGSRRNALQRIVKRYFGAGAANPVHVGDDVYGQFLAVGPHAAWANVNGVDARLTAHQLSHRYMEDLTEFYNPGEKIKLRIQKLDMVSGRPVMILSARPCELEESKSRCTRVRQGNRHVATMTSHRIMQGTNPRTKRKEPYYVASMWLEDVDMPAFATLATYKGQDTAYSGEKVLVEVQQFMDSGYVRCRILKFMK